EDDPPPMPPLDVHAQPPATCDEIPECAAARANAQADANRAYQEAQSEHSPGHELPPEGANSQTPPFGSDDFSWGEAQRAAAAGGLEWVGGSNPFRNPYRLAQEIDPEEEDVFPEYEEMLREATPEELSDVPFKPDPIADELNRAA